MFYHKLGVLILSTLLNARLALSECCYSSSSTRTVGNTYNWQANVHSSKLVTPDIIEIAFSGTRELSQNGGVSCDQSGESFECRLENKGGTLSFEVSLYVTLDELHANSVTANGETCTRSDTCQSFVTEDGNDIVAADDPNEGKINLGLLGWADPVTFWVVLCVLVFGVGGIAFMAWHRNRAVSSEGDPEEQMAESRNGPGWYGEKKPADADMKGYSTFAKKAGQSAPGVSSGPKNSRQRRRNPQVVAEQESSPDAGLGSGLNQNRQSQLLMPSIVPEDQDEASDDGFDADLERKTSRRSDPKKKAARKSRKHGKPRTSSGSSGDEKPLSRSVSHSKSRRTRPRRSSDSSDDDEPKERVVPAKREPSRRTRASSKRKETTPSPRGSSSRKVDTDRKKKRESVKPLVQL